MLDKVVELAAHLQGETGKKVLWGTAQLFKHPRFAHGGATSEPYPSQVHSRNGLCSSSWESTSQAAVFMRPMLLGCFQTYFTPDASCTPHKR